MRLAKKTFVAVLILQLFAVFSIASTIERNGIVYRSITDVASKLGMKSELNSRKGTQTLKSKWTKIDFNNNSRAIEINGNKVYLGYPVIKKKNRLYMPELDWQFTLSPILIPDKLSHAKKSIRTIVLDPGHGGHDPGAVNKKANLKEKDLTLKVAKKLAETLKRKGFRVYLTRSSDKFVSLENRSSYSRKRKADLFISIHFNSSTNSNSVGIESFAYTLLNQPSTSRTKVDRSDKIFRKANRFDSQNALLSYTIQESLIDKTKDRDRGLKRARFTVLEDQLCPGSLVELGFINNPNTVKKLKSKKYLDKLAISITEGILTYQKRLMKVD